MKLLICETDVFLTSCSQETMVHELLLDLNFRMKYNSAHNKRKEQERAETNKEVWDFLRRDLEQNPPNYLNVLKVLKEIRDGIKCLSGMMLFFLSNSQGDRIPAADN